jgi:hypothetical protein
MLPCLRKEVYKIQSIKNGPQEYNRKCWQWLIEWRKAEEHADCDDGGRGEWLLWLRYDLILGPPSSTCYKLGPQGGDIGGAVDL